MSANETLTVTNATIVTPDGTIIRGCAIIQPGYLVIGEKHADAPAPQRPKGTAAARADHWASVTGIQELLTAEGARND